MAGMAKSNGDKVIILRVSDKKEFVKKFNSMVKNPETQKRIDRAARLFGERKS